MRARIHHNSIGSWMKYRKGGLTRCGCRRPFVIIHAGLLMAGPRIIECQRCKASWELGRE